MDAAEMSSAELSSYIDAATERRKEWWKMAQYVCWWIVNGQRAAAGAKKMIPWEAFDPFGNEEEKPKKQVSDEQHKKVISKLDSNIESIIKGAEQKRMEKKKSKRKRIDE
jgi:hypothetical protein